MSHVQTSESPLAGGPIAEQDTSDEPIVVGIDAERNRFATAHATAASCGMTLRQVTPDDSQPLFTANFQALKQAFVDLAEVEAWVDQVTGAQPLHDPGRRLRQLERRAAVDAANRHQDQLDEAADFLRGPGGER